MLSEITRHALIPDNLPVRAIHARKMILPVLNSPESLTQTEQNKFTGEMEEINSDTAANVNEILSLNQRALHFSIDEETGTLIVQIIDLATKEIVRQISVGNRSLLSYDNSESTEKEYITGLVINEIA